MSLGDGDLRMSLSNHQLFEMINASPATGDGWAWMGLSLSYGSVWLVGVLLLVLWRLSAEPGRADLVMVATAAGSALLVSQLWGLLWPQPRPAALHMGVQLSPWPLIGAAMPSDEVAVLLAMGLSAFATRQLELLGFPLLTLGLVVGWSLVYIGEHFPYDVLASLPVAIACSVVSALRAAHLTDGK